MIRIVITVSSFACFVTWLVWFLKKDNQDHYQALAQQLLDDDDTTPTIINNAQSKEAK